MDNVYMLHDIMLQIIKIIRDVLYDIKIKLEISQIEFNYFLNNKSLRIEQACVAF